MFDPNRPDSSIDPYTGLLQDIDEVRAAALRVIDFAKILLSIPMVSMIIDEGMLIDLAFHLVIVESQMRVVSVADFNRKVGALLGNDPSEVNQLIREYDLSETLPTTHPDLKLPEYDYGTIDQNDPRIKSSRVLSSMAKRGQEKKTKEGPPVSLPHEIEEFLKALGNKGEDLGE